MAKAELQAAQSMYDQCLERARAAERAGDFEGCISHAVAAWEYVADMMRFERRWEEAEFRSVPCIEFVLRYAPLLLDEDSLNRLAAFLKAEKSVDRFASDDLAARLSRARERLRIAFRLWTHIEHNPEARQDELRRLMGGDQDEWRDIAERWEKMGLVRRSPSMGSYTLRLTTELDATTYAKCHCCGAVVRSTRLDLLQSRDCTGCSQVSEFCILFTETSDAVET
jgi:hypothetical protein